MTFWDWLYKAGPGWPSQRGWYAFALCLQTTGIFALLISWPELSSNEFFKVLANAVVITGWVGFGVAGRDSTVDREQVGKAQDITQQVLRQASLRDGGGVQ